ncbi:hypothetical protein AB1L42_17915 [Thalassoglobus sp. JC818]|uniref:hypothetical protein n=1 Tax=Thalassoglobus sp. JC818 TaxID=3232136 RepID=UPI00345ACA53
MEKESDRVELAQQAIDKWLDSSGFVSIEVLRQKQWLALPVPDILNPMEAEWLVDAIHIQGAREVVGIAFEYEGKPDVATIQVSQDSLLAYNGSNSWRFVMLTSTDETFLYYKDEANRYYLLCGSEEFVSHAYRCTLKTAKTMYFEEWAYLDHHSEEEKRFLTEVWNRYVGEKSAG